MIREGSISSIAAGAESDLLAGTQFSTITQAMEFVVRLVSLNSANAVAADALTYVFRRGSDQLSQGAASVVASGISNAEDAEIFRGEVGAGNLYLEVTNTDDAAVDVHFDITAY
ncbi:MAG: hypothetical protein OXG44_11480 [Gammaproteobacteria bacterium]|nr:hypothetical protein [Gammaproteobacteria bacterium]